MRRFSGFVVLLIALCGFSPEVRAGKDASPARKKPVAARAPSADPVTGLNFVAVPKGCFRMGSPKPARLEWDFHWPNLGIDTMVDADERPVHRVCVDAFEIGQTEVTAQAWTRVMGASPPFGQGDEPAAGVSWRDVREFLDRLNAKAERRYRLPTEAEWEYACRAGRPEEPARAEFTLIDEAWYAPYDRYRGQPSSVGRLPANPWGLHDMLGNVWEWTADVYRPDAYAHHVLYNPVTSDAGASGKVSRSLRGASFRSEYHQVRCAVRSHYPADASLPQIGFRLVRQE